MASGPQAAASPDQVLQSLSEAILSARTPEQVAAGNRNYAQIQELLHELVSDKSDEQVLLGKRSYKHVLQVR